VIQHRERLGCGNTASGSAWEGWARLRRCQPHLPACVHQTPRKSSRRELIARAFNLSLRRAPQREKLSAAASKPRCNWRERFLPGSSPLKHARIAITPDIVRPAHGAAIVEPVRDERFLLTLIVGGAKPQQDGVLPHEGKMRHPAWASRQIASVRSIRPPRLRRIGYSPSSSASLGRAPQAMKPGLKSESGRIALRPLPSGWIL
jgi:hypothetical protein